MANLDVERGAPCHSQTRRACWLVLASAVLAACGRKGDLYLPEDRAPAQLPEQGDDRLDRTDEIDDRGDR